MIKKTIPSPKLRQSIEQYFQQIQNNIKTININNNVDWQTTILAQEFHQQYFTHKLIYQIFHSPTQKSLNQVLRKNESNLIIFNRNYTDYIQARNHLAEQAGYSNYPSFLLHDSKIIEHNIPQIISLINSYLIQTTNQAQTLYSPWEITQSQYRICALDNFSTNAITLLAPHYPLLSSSKNNINYVNSDKSSTKYNPAQNTFTIFIDQKECPNHTFISLLHELSHVGFILSQFQQAKNPWLLGKYAHELSVAQTLSQTLPTISPTLWSLYQQEKRLLFVNIIFQLLAYSQPSLNPSTIYLKALQNAYPQAKLPPKSQYFYLFSEKIFSEPLNGLGQAVALVETFK